MFKRNAFEALLKLNGKTMEDVATILGVCRAAAYNKVRQKTDFTRAEVQKLKEAFQLTAEETIDIFYA